MLRLPLLLSALFLLAACSSSPSGIADDSTPAAEIGSTAPGFTLPDETGQDHSLAALHDGQYVILAFNRGLWWPYCLRQLGELQGEQERFASHNAVIVSVFREDEDGVAALAGIREEVGDGIVLLTDYQAVETGAYSREGIATYIIDPAGVVRAELPGTIRSRADSDAVLEALAEIIASDAS